MRGFPRLGSVNAALVALYFAPVWGRDGLRALISPFHGFEDRVHAAAASYYRELFDLGLSGLLNTSNALAGSNSSSPSGFWRILSTLPARWRLAAIPTVRRSISCWSLRASRSCCGHGPLSAAATPRSFGCTPRNSCCISSAMIVIVIERHVEEAAAGIRADVAAPQFGRCLTVVLVCCSLASWYVAPAHGMRSVAMGRSAVHLPSRNPSTALL